MRPILPKFTQRLTTKISITPPLRDGSLLPPIGGDGEPIRLGFEGINKTPPLIHGLNGRALHNVFTRRKIVACLHSVKLPIDNTGEEAYIRL